MDSEFLSTPSARRATVSHNDPDYLLRISIHALREEGDKSPLVAVPVGVLFLSTPSARRATFFNGFGIPGYLISIHALREEGDTS